MMGETTAISCLTISKAEIMVLLCVLLINRQVVSFILKSTLQPLKSLTLELYFVCFCQVFTIVSSNIHKQCQFSHRKKTD